MDELNFTLEIMITILATIGTFTLAVVSYSGLRRSQHISRMLLDIEEVRNIPKLTIPDGKAYISQSGQGYFDLRNVGGITAFVNNISLIIGTEQIGEPPIKESEMPPGTTSHNEFSAEPQEKYEFIEISVKYAPKDDKRCASYVEMFRLSQKEEDPLGTIIFELDDKR